MRGENEWRGRGNLTRDPELKYTENGMAIGKLSMAINEQYLDKASNSKRESVEFIDVTVFGKNAENCADHLRKGSPLAVKGKLKFETWEDKETRQKRSQLKVIANDVVFLDFSGSNDRPNERPNDRPSNR